MAVFLLIPCVGAFLLIPCVSVFLLIPCMSALLPLCPVGQGVLEVPGGAVDGPGVTPPAGMANTAEARVEVEGNAHGPGVSLREALQAIVLGPRRHWTVPGLAPGRPMQLGPCCA